MDKLLIVDASPLIYSVFETQGHLATTSGIPTGLRYGFLRSIRSYQERTKTDKVVIAFDVKGPIIKAEGIAHYKADRVFTEQKATMYSQVPDLRALIGLTKWTQIDAPGYEADDVLAALARAKAARGDQITIVSADNDLCQLVSEKIRIFRPASKSKVYKDHYLDREKVMEMMGVYPEHLCVYRSFCGDTSDNLHGVMSSTDAKNQLALFLTNDFPLNQPLTLDRFKEVTGAGTYMNLTVEQWETVDQNYKAMSLVRPPEVNVTKGTRDAVRMNELFEQLEFKSMFKFIPELTSA